MSELNFKIVDGLALPAPQRTLLRPGEPLLDENGTTHFLPRFFYEIDSWEQAAKTKLSSHFTVAELISVDCREARELLETSPRYVPCAISILAHYLEEFRALAQAPVFIASNGGYRSPAHQLSSGASLHCWGAAANIFRVGDTYLDDKKSIEKYAQLAAGIGPEFHAKPFGHASDESDDHLHLDIGYVSCVPRECNEAR
jgi:hypothetical protein